MENESKTYAVAIYLDKNAPQALLLEGALLPAFQWASPAAGGLWFGVDAMPVLRGGVDKAQLYVIDADHLLPSKAEIVVSFRPNSPFPADSPAPLMTYEASDPSAPGMEGYTPQTWSSAPTLVADPECRPGTHCVQRYSFTVAVAGGKAPIFFLDPEMEVEPGG